MPRYTKCPYFQSEKRQTISCEDIVRRFKSLEAKWSHMDRFCDADYMSCPFAVDLRKAYEKTEKGDIRALDKEKITALGKENAKLLSALGRAEKRIERQQKKIDELRAVNKSFTAKYDDLEQKRRAEYAKRRWEYAFQKWSDSHGIDSDNTEDYGCCGYGSMCDWCTDNSYGRPCVRALNAMCREKRIEIDYSDYDFKKVWRG